MIGLACQHLTPLFPHLTSRALKTNSREHRTAPGGSHSPTPAPSAPALPRRTEGLLQAQHYLPVHVKAACVSKF